MLVPEWYALFYPIAIILFIIVLLISSKKCRDYSIFRKNISYLGNRNNPSHKIFNPALTIIGLISIPLIYSLYLNLPKNILTYIGIGLLFLGCASTILMGFFPSNKERVHVIITGILFTSYLLGSILLVYPFLISNLMPKWIIFFSLLNLVSALFVINSLEYRHAWTYDLEKPWSKNFPFWEWVVFFSVFLWIVAVFLILISI